jgi:hypothetical protein
MKYKRTSESNKQKKEILNLHRCKIGVSKPPLWRAENSIAKTVLLNNIIKKRTWG